MSATGERPPPDGTTLDALTQATRRQKYLVEHAVAGHRSLREVAAAAAPGGGVGGCAVDELDSRGGHDADLPCEGPYSADSSAPLQRAFRGLSGLRD